MPVTQIISSSDVGSLPSSTAKNAVVTRPGLPPLEVTVRKTIPQGAPIGKIVLGTGGSGVGFYADQPGGEQLALSLVAMGYTVFQRSWASPGWFSDGLNINQCSTRYGDLVYWLAGEGKITCIGNSGGAAEIAYNYDCSKIHRAVLCSGPPFTHLEWTCEDPPSPEWVAEFDYLNGNYLSQWTSPIDLCGAPALCPILPTVPGYPESLYAMSLMMINILNFPAHTILGTNDTTVGVSMGILFYDRLTSTKSLTVVPGGNHWMPDTPQGRNAILTHV